MWVSSFKFSTYTFIKHYIVLFCFVLILFYLCKEIVGIYLLKNSKFFLYKKPLMNKSKRTAYECGFEPFNDSRGSFSITFYINAILFLFFDIEIAFLVPWVYVWNLLPYYAFFWGFLFFIILIVGFFYELKRGALNWNKKN